MCLFKGKLKQVWGYRGVRGVAYVAIIVDCASHGLLKPEADKWMLHLFTRPRIVFYEGIGLSIGSGPTLTPATAYLYIQLRNCASRKSTEQQNQRLTRRIRLSYRMP